MHQRSRCFVLSFFLSQFAPLELDPRLVWLNPPWANVIREMWRSAIPYFQSKLIFTRPPRPIITVQFHFFNAPRSLIGIELLQGNLATEFGPGLGLGYLLSLWLILPPSLSRTKSHRTRGGAAPSGCGTRGGPGRNWGAILRGFVLRSLGDI